MIFEKRPRERGASGRRSQGKSALGRDNSRRPQTPWHGRFWELTAGSPVGVSGGNCLKSGWRWLGDLSYVQDLGICGIWAGFRTPESGTLLNGSKQGRDVIGFTFSAAMWRTDWRGQE